jgi:hypothetical protein
VKDFSVYPQAVHGEYPFPETKLERAKCFSVVKYIRDKLKSELKSEHISFDSLVDS